MSDNITIQGTVEVVQDLQTFPSGFQKQVLVINTGGDYPQLIPIEFIKDSVNRISGLQPGTPLTVSVNLRGNEYNSKYYASIQGWKVEVDGQHQMAGATMPQKPAEPQTTAPADTETIPF